MPSFALVIDKKGNSVTATDTSAFANALRERGVPKNVQLSRSTSLIYCQDPTWQPAPNQFVFGNTQALVITPYRLPETVLDQINTHLEKGQQLPPTIDFPNVWVSITPEKTVVAADPVAKIPIYYCETSSTVLFASEPAILLRHPEVSSEPDLGIVAERICSYYGSNHQTLYKSIKFLPAGTYIEVAKNSQAAQLKRWHEFDVSPDASVSNEQLSTDIYASLNQATQELCDYSQAGKAALHLSGGLDSSVIAGLLQQQGKAGDIPALMSRYPTLENDESKYQEAVLAVCELQPVCFENRAFDPEQDLLSQQAKTRIPLLRPEPEVDDARRWCIANGIRSILSGIGGDEFFAYHDESLIELVGNGTFLSRHLTHYSAQDFKWALRLSARNLPASIRATRRAIRLNPFINKDFAKEVGIAQRVEEPAEPLRHHSVRRRRIDDVLGGASCTILREYFVNKESIFGFNSIEPFYHPNFITQVCRVNNQQLGFWNSSSDFDYRGYQRSIFREILPIELINRRDKSMFDARLAQDLLHPWCEQQINSLSLAKAGLIDQNAVLMLHSQISDAARNNRPPVSRIAALWAIIRSKGTS